MSTAINSSTNPDSVIEIAGFTKEAAKYSRIFDLLVVIAVITLFAGAIHLHVMLTVGDWDMYIDWKDRQFWPLVMPVSMIMFPAALQSIFWNNFRLPIGATVGATVLLITTWIGRWANWWIWTGFPFTEGVPSQAIAGALLMDFALIVLRNPLFTAIFGGFAFGFVFWPANYSALAPYFVPVEHQGTVASVADMIGYTFPRSNMPEYLRIIERGTLRTFGSSVSWVSAFFAGFLCIFAHYAWWYLGVFASQATFLKSNPHVMSLMGLESRPAPTREV
jgi:methane/ammonia monooxygenase subunit A